MKGIKDRLRHKSASADTRDLSIDEEPHSDQRGVHMEHTEHLGDAGSTSNELNKKIRDIDQTMSEIEQTKREIDEGSERNIYKKAMHDFDQDLQTAELWIPDAKEAIADDDIAEINLMHSQIGQLIHDLENHMSHVLKLPGRRGVAMENVMTWRTTNRNRIKVLKYIHKELEQLIEEEGRAKEAKEELRLEKNLIAKEKERQLLQNIASLREMKSMVPENDIQQQQRLHSFARNEPAVIIEKTTTPTFTVTDQE